MRSAHQRSHILRFSPLRMTVRENTAISHFLLEGISRRQREGAAITDVVMVRRNIFIEIFAIEDILDGKLHGEILVELVVCIEVQEEVRIT